jgi:hypothetical protein
LTVLPTLPFLNSAEELRNHLRDLWPEDSRGDEFELLCQQVLEADPTHRGVHWVITGGKSDGSRDLTGRVDKRIVVVAESKFQLRDRATVEKVLSDWMARDAAQQPAPRLFDEESPPLRYILLTTSQAQQHVDAVLRASPERPTTAFLRSLISDERFTLVEGERLVERLRKVFAERYGAAVDLALDSVRAWQQVDDTWFGVVDAAEIARLREEHGPALIFENVRPFLGATGGDRGTKVNKDIIQSVREAPERFLARNNGIVVKASSVEHVTERRLRLTGANIVNGGQTANCLHEANVAPEEAQVFVKVVRTDDAWDVTESANNQNEVSQIDLKIARYVRPQMIALAGARRGEGLTAEDSPDFDTVFRATGSPGVSAMEVRGLFIGLFSNSPTNAVENNYDRLRVGDVEKVSRDLDNVVQELVDFQKYATESRNWLESQVKRSATPEDWNRFKRFHERGSYRALHDLLALACFMQADIPNLGVEASRELVEDALVALVSDEGKAQFRLFFRLSWSTIAARFSGEMEGMTRQIQSASFPELFSDAMRRYDDLQAAMETDGPGARR